MIADDRGRGDSFEDLERTRAEVEALLHIVHASAQLRRAFLAVPMTVDRLAHLRSIAAEVIGRPIRLHRLDGSPLARGGGEVPTEEAIVQSWRERAPVRDGQIAVVAVGFSAIEILVVADLQPTDGARELALLDETAFAVSLEAARLQALFEAELNGRGLARIIVGGSDPGEIRVTAMAANYDLDRPHRAVVCVPLENSFVDVTFGSVVHAAARKLRAGELLLPMDDRVVLLAHGHVDWQAFREIVEHDSGQACCLGVGDWRDDALCLGPSCAEAALAVRLRRFAPDGIAFFSELRSHGLLASLEATPAQTEFVAQTIGELLTYDDEHHSELVPTMEAYFGTGCNAASAAASLHIHRNTLKYRLARVKALTRLDPENPADRFDLQLATEMWSVREALRT